MSRCGKSTSTFDVFFLHCYTTSISILFNLFGFFQRFGSSVEDMRTGQFAALEVMSPSRYVLDQRMAEVLVHARAMEFQSLDLEVSARGLGVTS